MDRHSVGPRSTVFNRNLDLTMLIPHVKPGHLTDFGFQCDKRYGLHVLPCKSIQRVY